MSKNPNAVPIVVDPAIADELAAIEKRLPPYLAEDLDRYKRCIDGWEPTLLDAFWGELYSSINVAFYAGELTPVECDILRNVYLY